MVKLDEIRNKNTFMDTAKWQDHMKYILIEFVSNILPKRCEIGNIHIIKKNATLPKYNFVDTKNKNEDVKQSFDINTANYLYIDDNEKMVLYLNKFKTYKKKNKDKDDEFIQIKEDIPTLIAQIIIKSLKILPRPYLFCTKYGSKEQWEPYYKQNSYTTFFQSAFKLFFNIDKFTINDLRHSYVTNNIDFNTISNADIKLKAKLMGTSVRTLFREYRDRNRLSDNRDDSDDED